MFPGQPLLVPNTPTSAAPPGPRCCPRSVHRRREELLYAANSPGAFLLRRGPGVVQPAAVWGHASRPGFVPTGTSPPRRTERGGDDDARPRPSPAGPQAGDLEQLTRTGRHDRSRCVARPAVPVPVPSGRR